MNTAISAPECIVRPPWPDEIPRLFDAFPGTLPRQRFYPLILVAQGEPDRIVGVAAVFPAVGATSRLTVAVRPRFIHQPEADKLVAAATELAGRHGAQMLIAGEDIRAPQPHRDLLNRNGFSPRSTQLWRISVEVLQCRFSRPPLSRAGSRMPQLSVERAKESDLTEVRRLLSVVESEFGHPIYADNASADGPPDASIVLVARKSPGVIGTVVLRKAAEKTYAIAGIGVSATSTAARAFTFAALARAAVAELTRLGASHIVLPVDPVAHPTIGRLVARQQGRNIGVAVEYIRHL